MNIHRKDPRHPMSDYDYVPAIDLESEDDPVSGLTRAEHDRLGRLDDVVRAEDRAAGERFRHDISAGSPSQTPAPTGSNCPGGSHPLDEQEIDRLRAQVAELNAALKQLEDQELLRTEQLGEASAKLEELYEWNAELNKANEGLGTALTAARRQAALDQPVLDAAEAYRHATFHAEPDLDPELYAPEELAIVLAVDAKAAGTPQVTAASEPGNVDERLFALLQEVRDRDSLDITDEEIREGHHRITWYEWTARKAYKLGLADAAKTPSGGHL